MYQWQLFSLVLLRLIAWVSTVRLKTGPAIFTVYRYRTYSFFCLFFIDSYRALTTEKKNETKNVCGILIFFTFLVLPPWKAKVRVSKKREWGMLYVFNPFGYLVLMTIQSFKTHKKLKVVNERGLMCICWKNSPLTPLPF